MKSNVRCPKTHTSTQNSAVFLNKLAEVKKTPLIMITKKINAWEIPMTLSTEIEKAILKCTGCHKRSGETTAILGARTSWRHHSNWCRRTRGWHQNTEMTRIKPETQAQIHILAGTWLSTRALRTFTRKKTVCWVNGTGDTGDSHAEEGN